MTCFALAFEMQTGTIVAATNMADVTHCEVRITFLAS